MKNYLQAVWPVVALCCLTGTYGCKKEQTASAADAYARSGATSLVSFEPSSAGRSAALSDYDVNYLGSALSSSAIGWTGNTDNCDAGTTPDSVKQYILRRLNYFRRLSGLPAVTMDSSYSAMAQQAALMIKSNNALNHYPPLSWHCATADGQLASANSNLALGANGPGAVDLYVQDAGVTDLGHRRWALYPPLTKVGTGDTDFSNALWVIGSFGARPALDFSAYPGSGYIPAPLVYDTWSISVYTGDFSAATVSVTDANGKTYPATTSVTPTGYGDNTLSWTFQNNLGQNLQADLQLTVTVSGVKVSGQVKSYQYPVYIFVP
jgi:uncharacterized protein YkwD